MYNYTPAIGCVCIQYDTVFCLGDLKTHGKLESSGHGLRMEIKCGGMEWFHTLPELESCVSGDLSLDGVSMHTVYMSPDVCHGDDLFSSCSVAQCLLSERERRF